MHKATKTNMYKEEQIADEIIPLLLDYMSPPGATSIASCSSNVTIGRAKASMHPTCLPLPSCPTTRMETHRLLCYSSGSLIHKYVYFKDCSMSVRTDMVYSF